MSLVTKLSKVFKWFSPVESAAKGVIDSAVGIADRFITTESDRKEFHAEMEKLAQSSKSVVAQTARPSLMWSVSIVLVYQVVVRDFLAHFLNVDLPDAGVNLESLINQVFTLLGGVA